MAVSLRDFSEDDLPLLHHWARRIDSAQFMSRIMPLGNNFAEAQGRALVWSVILDDEAEVGAIWGEKGKPGATFKYVTMERDLTRGNAT